MKGRQKTCLHSASLVWPLANSAQQPGLPSLSQPGCEALGVSLNPVAQRPSFMVLLFLFSFQEKELRGRGSQAEIQRVSKVHVQTWPGKTSILMIRSTFLAKHLPCPGPMFLSLMQCKWSSGQTNRKLSRYTQK